MRIDFTDHGIEFVAEHEYESLPAVRFDGCDRLHIGLTDDMAVGLRDLLSERYPTGGRDGLADTLSELADDALETIRAAEDMGNQPLYQKWRMEYATIVRVADALGVDVMDR